MKNIKKFNLYSIFIIIFAFLILFSHFPAKKSHALEIGGDAKVIVSRCYVYSDATFEAEKLKIVENEDEVFVTLKFGEVVKINGFNGDFAWVTTAEDKNGYVYKYYLSDNKSQEIYPVFNASLRRESQILDIDFEETGLKASKNARVYLYEGFDDDKKYTAVQIVLEDGSLYNGYILTEDIKPDGVSALLIVGLSVIIATVTIVLSLLFIKKKKKKEKKNTNQ